MKLGSVLNKIGEGIFNWNFYWQYERPVRKSMKRVDAYFNEAIDTLNAALKKTYEKSAEVECEESDSISAQCDSLQASLVELYKREHTDKCFDGIISEVIQIEEYEGSAHGESVESGRCTTMEQFQACVARGLEEIVLEDEVYQLWKYFARAATKRRVSQTINVKGEWNVTFGYGENMVILSTPDKGENTIGVYRIVLNPREKRIIFTRVQ